MRKNNFHVRVIVHNAIQYHMNSIARRIKRVINQWPRNAIQQIHDGVTRVNENNGRALVKRRPKWSPLFIT
ncbi:Uncharacterised protein [Acinetobacter baumannii]|nr:Uncharacterised protein [Acinetobacter baumannii]